MPTLSRRPGEAVRIGDNILVRLVAIEANQATLNIDAPDDMAVDQEPQLSPEQIRANSKRERQAALQKISDKHAPLLYVLMAMIPLSMAGERWPDVVRPLVLGIIGGTIGLLLYRLFVYFKDNWKSSRNHPREALHLILNTIVFWWPFYGYFGFQYWPETTRSILMVLVVLMPLLLIYAIRVVTRDDD